MSRTKNSYDNKLIRANMVGADDLLDAMHLIHRLVERLEDRGLAGATEAREAYGALDRLRSLMVELCRAREKI